MAGDAAKGAEVEETYSKLEEEENAFIGSFVGDNSNNDVGAYIAVRHMSSGYEVEQLDSIAQQFSPEIASLEYKTRTG